MKKYNNIVDKILYNEGKGHGGYEEPKRKKNKGKGVIAMIE